MRSTTSAASPDERWRKVTEIRRAIHMARAISMREMRKQGATLKEVGLHFGVAGERVRQLVRRIEYRERWKAEGLPVCNEPFTELDMVTSDAIRNTLNSDGWRQVLRLLRATALQIGMPALNATALHAENIVFTLPPESQQAAALIAAVFRLACNTPEGRQAAVDLGLEPIAGGVDPSPQDAVARILASSIPEVIAHEQKPGGLLWPR